MRDQLGHFINSFFKGLKKQNFYVVTLFMGFTIHNATTAEHTYK